MTFLVYWLDKYCSGRGDMGNLMKYETRAIVNGIMIAHITVNTTDVEFYLTLHTRMSTSDV